MEFILPGIAFGVGVIISHVITEHEQSKKIEIKKDNIKVEEQQKRRMQ